MTEDQITTNPEKNEPSPPPAQEEKSSGNKYSDGIVEIEEAAEEIIAVADILILVIDEAIQRQRHSTSGSLFIDLDLDTVPKLLRMLRDNGDYIKGLANEEFSRQLEERESREDTPGTPLQ